jgi:hypothetical protein
MRNYVLIILLISLVVLAGCGSSQPPANSIRDYADPTTENMLAAMNTNNYAQFSQDFDLSMKAHFDQGTFRTIFPAISARIGQYLSKDFVSTETKDQSQIVIYRAKFSLEPEDVTVRMVINTTGGQQTVAGFWLDSPKLRQKFDLNATVTPGGTNNTPNSASGITENILTALNANNYPLFSRDFDDKMRSALSEPAYQEKMLPIKAKIGQYISKELVSADNNGQNQVVIYRAKFSLEPGDVTVKTVLSNMNGRNVVSGFWLDSPILREN